ncbi:hypothetical protein DFH06DRAFT_1045407 [Mycena polygramma]|nr:hypothetical protein DFH06DRAFT_1045407 [Mycena polygramma]
MSIICEQCGHRSGEAPSSTPTALPMPLSSSAPLQLRAALEAVNQAILGQRMYLSELEAQRRTLQLKLAQIVYPVHLLPPEIIARIFVDCLPVHGRVRPSPTAPPPLLAQICRHWREIALGTCELWRSLDVAFIQYPGDTTEVPNDGALPIIKKWLSRAKGHPLSLTIRSMHHQIPTPIIPLIFSVAAQVHTLELALSNNDFDIVEQNMAAFPCLQRFALGSRPGYHCPGYERLSIEDRAPLLVELRIESVPSSMSLLPSSLTNLEIRDEIQLSTLFDVFRQCPHLLHLTVHVNHHYPDNPLPIMTLPHLQSLVIGGSGLDFLDLPALRHLDLRENYAFHPFIQRSRCALEHLGIEIDWDDLKSGLLEILRAAPSLTSLTVDVQSYMESFTEVLDKNPALFPQLTILRISAEHSNFDHLPFIQLLRERRAPYPGRTRLAFARLDLRSEEELGEEWWLSRSATIEYQKLIAQGLEFQATCVDYYNCSCFWPKGSRDPCESFPQLDSFVHNSM